MHQSWARRIRRAEDLGDGGGATTSLIAFYARLLRAQSEVYDRCLASGAIGDDVTALARDAEPLLRVVQDSGPETLAQEAAALLACDASTIANLLLAHWRDRSDRDFFGKAILQPYAQRLVDDRVIERTSERDARRCRHCGGAPQLAILDAAGRQLLCATCLTPWPFARVACTGCGDEDEKKIGYFRSPEQPHVRVDVCESCLRYIKTIDLTQLGLAEPLVDEVASAPLDLWAREHGYEKIELNLVGL